MKELAREEKLQVAYYHVLGLSSREIEEKIGVSHGSIINILKELETGKLNVI